MVTKNQRYDFPLGDEIAALECELAHAGWFIGFMQLPGFTPDEYGAFFDPAGAHALTV